MAGSQKRFKGRANSSELGERLTEPVEEKIAVQLEISVRSKKHSLAWIVKGGVPGLMRKTKVESGDKSGRRELG